MSNKTCGECKHRYSYHYDEDCDGRCRVFPMYRVSSDKRACSKFEPIPPPTYGDRVRQMSDADLAEMLVYPVKPMNVNGSIHYEFTSCLLLGKSYPVREQAVFLTERRLNAPADCEVEDGE